MIHTLTQWIMDQLQAHGSLSVFIGVIIESVIVPIPSPLIIMGAGAILIDTSLSASQSFSPILLKIVLPGAIASTLGAYIAYGVAYWGGRPLIDKFKNYLGFEWEDILKLEEHFIGKRAPLYLMGLRALPIIPLSLVSAVAGTVRMPIFPFSLWTFVGSVPRCLFLGYLGWLMHDTYVAIAKGFDRLEGIISGLIVLACCVFVLWMRKNIKKIEK